MNEYLKQYSELQKPVSYTHLDVYKRQAFKTYWAKRLEEDPDIDPYNDLFCDLLEENAKADRKSTRLNSSHIQKSRMPSSA